MATLRLESADKNQLKLGSSFRTQLGRLMFSLVWLGVMAFMVVTAILSTRINVTVLFFAALFAIPLILTLGSLVFPSDVIMDRTDGTLVQRRLFFFIPVFSSVMPFSEIANVEIQTSSQFSSNQHSQVWSIFAVTRGSKRIRLNWGDKANECEPMAQSLADFIGVRVVRNEIPIPAWLKQIVPELNQATNNQTPQTLVGQMIEQIRTVDVSPSGDASSSANAPTMTADATVTDGATTDDVSALSIRDLEQRLANDATDSQARFILARKCHANGQLDRAIELYGETLKLDTTNPAAQNDLGVALQQRGKRADAEEAYRRAIALEPFLFSAHLNLALLLRGTNRAVDASREFFLARQSARGDAETRLAEAASTGAKAELQLSNN